MAVPAEERDELVQRRRITPERLLDDRVQTELSRLGRLTAKTKAINQVRFAASWIDSAELLASLRLYPLPAGAHADHWRAPSDVAPPYAAALEDLLRRAVAAGGAMSGFSLVGGVALPLGDNMARQLRLSADDQRRVNMEVLWPLWQAAGGGRFKPDVARALAEDPTRTQAQTGCGEAVAAGLLQLKERWAELGLAADDCADATQKPVIEAALGRATAAWSGLASGWTAARHGVPVADLQTRVDALVTAVGELRTHLDRDRAARGWKPLHIDTRLELTYWRWKGFSVVAWLFLLAVPLLALGSLGRIRWALWLGLGLFGVGFCGQAASFLIRWQLAERIPLANLYESMAAAALLASLVALPVELVLLARSRRAAQSPVAGSLALAASLFGCVIVMALSFLERHEINAFISPAMPILSEFWMRIHVSCVVASYGIIGLGGLMSVVYLIMRVWLPWNDARAVAWDRSTFAMNGAASVVLWAGLVLGAVWAAVSWGRPWGWDPKEVFALLTWIVFVILVHVPLSVPPERRGIATALISLLAFLVMGFNWYFVNVKLAGLHSYA
jgi:ABC-type transport system involved in cytochrome c biogenesis permease subunit